MRREIAGGGDQRQPGLFAVEELVLPDRGLDALDRVEVAVLAQEAGTEDGDQAVRVTAGAEVRRDELRRLVDPLLLVEEREEIVDLHLAVDLFPLLDEQQRVDEA